MKTFVFGVLFTCSSLFACSQSISPKVVPTLVKNTLLTNFPDAFGLKWEKKQNLYKANFKLGLTDCSSFIDATGKLVLYKSDVTGYDLPKDISAVLQDNFSAYLIEDLEKVEKAGEVYYQVELEKSNQKLKQVFSDEGQLLTNARYWE
ncbi:PepSY-like domain-containing protein [Adhaeribacter radiodurans]|uniref:Putative beta-lactamase-inhibitor-like PepSY-like domain-containing protein n=1 Tax=Adhaeribacter radiodurans TaxID=2745197 RepID=A0A7L7LFC5_9BACT|nr:hypothetical protein [Adhaeribacter radiodurans]QMU31394.1 hypothetical protein HUW48_26680 [Adhaeribacter radiodurans]